MKFCLSPMAGYTDPAFRALCGKYGADFTITEMVSAEGTIRGKEDETTKIVGRIPTGIQLFGENPKNILKAAIKFEKSKFKEININAGCPVNKVVKKGAGAALLKNPKKLEEILEELNGTVKKPISVKIRLGWKDSRNLIKIAKLIERNGVSSIIVHARTAAQGYSGKANWKFIKEIKEKIGIPIYGNGDIINWEDAYKKMKESKCDGVYIGRAALYNPFIFRECKEKKSLEFSKELISKGFLEYFKIRKKYNINSNPLKMIAMGFCKGFKGAREMRKKISEAKTNDMLLPLFL